MTLQPNGAEAKHLELSHDSKRTTKSRGQALSRFYPDAIAVIVSSAIAFILAVWSTGARPSNLGIVWHRDDLISYYAAVKGMLENGWWTPNPDLGYPFAQDSSTFPSPDVISFWVLKLFSLVTGNPFASVNLYFLIGFPAVAFAAYFLFRSARISIVVSAILATSFSLLPWHFERLQHLFLANYSFMVVGLILVGLAARGIPDRDMPKVPRRTLFVVSIVAAVFVGLGGVYYAVFTSLVGVIVLAVQFVAGRHFRSSVRSIVILLVVPISTGATLAFIKLTGTTSAISGVVRSPRESLMYGGDLYSLFRVYGNGLGNWFFPARLKELQPLLPIPVAEGDAQLNLVAVVAICIALILVAVALVSMGGEYRRGRVVVQRNTAWLLIFAVSVSVFASGGVGALFTAVLGPSIRAWGRMSIGVAGVALVVLGILLTMWLDSRRFRVLCIAVVALIGIITVLDPVAAPTRIRFPDGKAIQANLGPYVADAEAKLADRCPVLEVPIGLFPEVKPSERQRYYEDLLPYLYSTDLRWSYGGLQYTAEGRWAKEHLDVAPSLQVSLAKRAGFCALQLDTNGFKVEDEASIVSTYTKLLGPPIARTADSRWVMYSLANAPS